MPNRPTDTPLLDPASPALHASFNTFLTTPHLFALPITITSESLTPLDPLLFRKNSFSASLPQLEPHVHPRQPRYIILRRSPEGNDGTALTILTYIPPDAPVRAKTLFAATRTTLVRELGRERFENGNLFLTDESEVLDPGEWEQRDEKEGGVEGGALTREEREERDVRRAVEEERYSGTKGRDLMGYGGSGGITEAGGGEKTKGLRLKMDDSAKKALAEMGQQGEGNEGDGKVVQLSIDLATETLILSTSSSDVSPLDLPSKISANTPSYTFYHHPSSTSVIFIYCCPSSSKIKERMLYASSRANVVQVARDEGVEVSKRIEIGAPDEIGEDRLEEEVAPSGGGGGGAAAAAEDNKSGTRQGFARPKRPGKR